MVGVDPWGKRCRDGSSLLCVRLCLMKLSFCMANDPIKNTVDQVRNGKVRIEVCDDPINDLGENTDGDYGWRPWPLKGLIRLKEGFDCSTFLHEISHFQDGFWGKLPWNWEKSEDKASDYGVNKYKYNDNCCDEVRIGDFYISMPNCHF